MKRNDRYRYATGRQLNEDSGRVYDVAGYRLPSVTSILSRTKDQEFLKNWKAKVGEKEAERIKNLSSVRGTAMHKYLESYIEGIGYEDLTDTGRQAKSMAEKVIEIGLAPVDEYYGSEVTMYYPGLYAGQTDLVGVYQGRESIIDFKQSNKPKRAEWITDYKLQMVAYAMAHDFVHGSEIEQGVILMCTPDNFFQRFIVNGSEFRGLKVEWLKALSIWLRVERFSNFFTTTKERAFCHI